MTQQTSMPRLRPVIRVFVSSTFSDMKHERNALAAEVYPKLEQLCQKNGFQFQAIDLRWGVSSEAGLDHRTMRICFDELRRAQEISPKPNFLILLGDRYGWRPLPEEIFAKELEVLEGMPHAESGEHAEVLRSWYLRDDNAVPPVYVLQSRRQNLDDGKDYTQDAVWSGVQDVLWRIINRAMPADQLQGRFAGPLNPIPPIVRFQASATEQEIWQGALRVQDAKDHVLAFFRKIENLGEFSQPDVIKDFVDVAVSGEIDAPLTAEQGRLKKTLTGRLGEDNVFRPVGPVNLAVRPDETGKPKANITTEHLGRMCADIEGRLTEIIEAQINEYWRSSGNQAAERSTRELEIEQQEHTRVGEERGSEKTFVGRKAELYTIRNYLSGDSTLPLVVHGASGCGKTALMARAVAEFRKEEGRGKNTEVIVRFIGVTPRASELRGLLTSVCRELRLRYPREGELPTDIKLLEVELQEQFKAATAERPLILFLDALDQLADVDGGQRLHWIPVGTLPGHVKLVVSCLSDRDEKDPAGQPYGELQRRQLPANQFINLEAFSEDEARVLLFERWLPQAGRMVSQDQRARIEQRLASAACRQPIYLKLLFEEARLWRSYEGIPDLGEGVPALLKQLFERLSRPTNHGPLLVESVLGYLAASREGLAENEILEILFRDNEYKKALDDVSEQARHELPVSVTRIPIAIWSRLRFDLASYLTERAATGANVLTFYHRQVAEWVQEYFAKSPDQSWQPHQRLAGYFLTVADSEGDRSWKGSRRGFSELPYHLTCARDWYQLVGDERDPGVLTDLKFIEAKCEVELLNALAIDYRYALKNIPTDDRTSDRELLQNFWEFVIRERTFLANYGHLVWQQAMNSKASEQVTRQANDRWASGMEMRPWLWCKTSPASFSRLSFKASQPGIQCAALSPVGDLIVAGHANGSVSLHEVNTGIELTSIPICRAGITAITFLLNEGNLVAASSDGYIHSIDTDNAIILHSIHAHDDTITALIPGKQQEELLTVCADGTARFWSAGEWKQERTKLIVRNRNSLLCGAFMKDADAVAFGCSDGRLLLIQYGNSWQEIEQNWDCFAPITSCAAGSGSILFYASQEDVLKCANVSPSGLEQLWQGKITGTVTAIAPGKNCKDLLIGWSSGDVSVKSENGVELLHLHGNNVRFLSMNRNGSRIISVHESGEISMHDIPHSTPANSVRIKPESIDKIYCLEESRNAFCLTFPKMGSGIHVGPTPPLLISNYDLEKDKFTCQYEISDTLDVGQIFVSEPRGWMFVPREKSEGENQEYGVSVFSLIGFELVKELKTKAQVESIMITPDHDYIGIIDRSSHLAIFDLAGFHCLLQCDDLHSYDQDTKFRNLVVDPARNFCRIERDGSVLEISINGSEVRTGNQSASPGQNWKVQYGERVIFFPDRSTGRLVHSSANRVVWLQEVSRDCFLILEENGVLSRFDSNGVHYPLLSDMKLSPRPVVLGDDVFAVSRSGWLHGCDVGQAHPNYLLPVAEEIASLASRNHGCEILLGTLSGEVIVIQPMNKGILHE